VKFSITAEQVALSKFGSWQGCPTGLITVNLPPTVSLKQLHSLGDGQHDCPGRHTHTSFGGDASARERRLAIHIDVKSMKDNIPGSLKEIHSQNLYTVVMPGHCLVTNSVFMKNNVRDVNVRPFDQISRLRRITERFWEGHEVVGSRTSAS